MTVRLPSWWPKALLVAAALFLLWRHDAGQRSEGALRQQIHDVTAQKVAREKVIAAMIVTTAKIDTVAGKATTVYRTAKVDYQHIADSIAAAMQAKGQPVPPVVLACNAALAAADTALTACARQVAIRDRLLAAKDSLQWATDSLLTLERKRRPGRFGCVAGGVASSRGVQPGIGCGIRLTR